MQITKTLLKQLIKEEFEDITEDLPVAPSDEARSKHEKRQAARKKCVEGAIARGRTQQQAESECKGAGSLEKETTDESVVNVNERKDKLMKITKQTLKQLIREEIESASPSGEAASSVKPLGDRMYTYVDKDGNTYYSDAVPGTRSEQSRQLTAADTVGAQMLPFLSTLLQRHHEQQHLEPEAAVEPEI